MSTVAQFLVASPAPNRLSHKGGVDVVATVDSLAVTPLNSPSALPARGKQRASPHASNAGVARGRLETTWEVSYLAPLMSLFMREPAIQIIRPEQFGLQ